ncbi:amidohydrolase family protein [Hyphomonas sp. WL0036]|uniref:amidohydrolase family protein n=1 Tax=Hyphomonas sediminis TaxID=2866160 RepID=UPI001C7E5748|nr:amidohydrolase family protein [Hyphomonas sediminis]MBY9067172.1 amidohydrolase family protein [Hyphomonas sediminis]
MIERIDSHMHIWTLARGDYDWMTPDLGAIHRDYAVDDAWAQASAARVTGTILVQAAATAAETDFLLATAATDERVAGVVGWVDFEAADATIEIERRSDDPRVVGLRPMIADVPDPGWILRRDFVPLLDQMAQCGLVLDGHARADLIPVMTQLADQHPSLQIVLNHAGKPRIDTGDLAQWFADIAALAKRPNVACKFSGLLTEAGHRTSDEAIGEIARHVRNCFGPHRVLWGSDWPVLNLAGSYSGWAAQSERIIDRLFPEHREAVWAGNAKRIYLSKSEF